MLDHRMQRTHHRLFRRADLCPGCAQRVPGLFLGSPPNVARGGLIERGHVLPEVIEILEIAASTNVVVASGCSIDAEADLRNF